MGFAMLFLRIVVGALFVGHGTQKLFGWFDGPGLEGTTSMMESLGYRPARRHAELAGWTEAGAGALLVLGLFTPIAAAAVIGVMVNAIAAVHLPKGPWIMNGGYEYALVMLFSAVALAAGGPGWLSFDHLLGWSGGGALWAAFALFVGLIGASIVLTPRAPDEIAETGSERRAHQQEHQAA